MPLRAEKKFRCEIVTWGGIVRDARKLAWKIRDSGYAPDIVVAIGRGGYVPARILCDYLLVHDLASIKVEHWGTCVVKEQAVIKFPLAAEIRNMRVLLVDDVTDTGETLKVSLQYLKSFEPREVRTAVLIHKSCSTIMPDYYLRKIIKWRWVIFPWHVMEDLTEFVQKLKEEGIRGEEELQSALMQRYCIDVSLEKIRETSATIG